MRAVSSITSRANPFPGVHGRRASRYGPDEPRTAGTLEREPPAEHRCGNTACRAAARSAPAVSIDSGRHRRNDRDLSAQGWPLTDQPARQPVTLASVENSDGVPGAGPIMTQRWPRTGSACKPAIRCPNASSPRCSDAPPAAGHAPGSPMHSNHRKDPTRERSHDRLIPRTVAFQAPVIPEPVPARGILGPAHPHLCRPPSLFRSPGLGWRRRAPPKRITAWVLPGYAAVIRTTVIRPA